MSAVPARLPLGRALRSRLLALGTHSEWRDPLWLAFLSCGWRAGSPPRP